MDGHCVLIRRACRDHGAFHYVLNGHVFLLPSASGGPCKEYFEASNVWILVMKNAFHHSMTNWIVATGEVLVHGLMQPIFKLLFGFTAHVTLMGCSKCGKNEYNSDANGTDHKRGDSQNYLLFHFQVVLCISFFEVIKPFDGLISRLH
jgi:hypothetical protein